MTSEGRTEAAERAYRQAQARDAFDRLTALKFDDSADIHNISMGWYDPSSTRHPAIRSTAATFPTRSRDCG